MLAKVPSILPILIATINHQNSACKGCYCTVGAWPFLAILMYAKAILSILADTILILFNTDVMLWMRRCRQSWHTLSYCRWIPASADARPSPTVDRGGLAQPRPPRKLRPPHLAISQKEGSSQHFLFSTWIFYLIIIRINPVMFHKRSYLEGKSGVSGGVSKSPLFVRFDSSVADRSCKPILKTVRWCYKYKNTKM